MPSLQQKITEIESRSCHLTDDEVTLRRKQIDDFLAISAFEGLRPSKTSLKLQELFAAKKLTSSEYIELCRQYSSELGV
jgi:hypothetical protein